MVSKLAECHVCLGKSDSQSFLILYFKKSSIHIHSVGFCFAKMWGDHCFLNFENLTVTLATW